VDTTSRDRWLAHAEQRLRGAGVRSGAGRTAVVELLAREGQCLLTPQQIGDRLRGDGVGSHATVYRTLEVLHELGLVHRVNGLDGVARYEVADPDHHHHHFVDEETGDVVPFEDDDLERVIEALGDRLGVELTGHDVILRGTKRR
jgi:Fur family ferric uptake transcriptional regulator